jgi:hypothetical protein
MQQQTWYEKAAGHRPKKIKRIHEKREQPEITPIKVPQHRQNIMPTNISHQFPLFDKKAVPPESNDIIEHFNDIIAGTRPLNSKQQEQLPTYIKILSHKLTDERGTRRIGYMNETTAVTAYIHYFQWWNLVRLIRLFSNLPADAFTLSNGDYALDIGSGPLTVPIALWLARPELRKVKLTWYCMDISQTVLAAGEELFLSIAARTSLQNEDPWKIIRVKGALGTVIKQKAALVTCANVLNELTQTNTMPPDFLAKKYTQDLLSYVSPQKTATVLIIEPGFPRAARFVSLLRDALIRKNFMPKAPCTHTNLCPMDGKRGGKWCNFAFPTEDVPPALQKLSTKAGLPKERAVLSFILSRRDEIQELPVKPINIRITSDAIYLPELHRSGYYACSPHGLLLVIDEKNYRPKNGDLMTISTLPDQENQIYDQKTGAIEIVI